ncbi:MAG: hypothetical protein ABFR75_02475 [Acidobacteriota bacterium]
MKPLNFLFLIVILFFSGFNCKSVSDENNDSNDLNNTEAIIADHTSVDLNSIPDEWITKVKEVIGFHYCHTSHGSQIMIGLERLMNGSFSNITIKGSKYNYYPDNCNMPDTDQYLSLMDGQYSNGYCETYVSPDLYWESDHGLSLTRNMLNSHNVNVSMFAWCSQLDYYSSSEVENYLNKMAALEKEFPNIVFIYMTGNAQSSERNRYDRNNQIRQFCKENNKILFDFADLDCWYNGGQNIVNGIPMEHNHYHGDQAGHTTYESCENKAKAFWWLMARIAGWNGK